MIKQKISKDHYADIYQKTQNNYTHVWRWKIFRRRRITIMENKRDEIKEAKKLLMNVELIRLKDWIEHRLEGDHNPITSVSILIKRLEDIKIKMGYRDRGEDFTKEYKTRHDN